jgi:hypothetical protein
MALTHLGQQVQDHVTLEVVGGLTGGCGAALLDFVRILPDGSSQSGPQGGGWRIPRGRFLVITDVDWQYVHPDAGNAAGHIEVLRLFVGERRVFESTLVLSTTGEGGISESMTAGFVVASSTHICPDVIPGPVGPPSGLQHLILRGYLVSR